MHARKRLVGPISLAVMVAGLIVTELLIRLDVLVSPWWRVLAGGFEAGTIGGLADWYAVHVLFYPAPWPLSWLPLFRRHSNLVVRNRPQLSRNIAQTVQTEWLSPESVHEYLRKVPFARLLLEYLDEPANRSAAISFTRRALLAPLARQIDDPAVAAGIESWLRDRFPAAGGARVFGQALQLLTGRGRLDKIWADGLDAVQRAIRSPRAGELLGKSLRRATQIYLPTFIEQLRGPQASQFLADRIRQRLTDADLARNVGSMLHDAIRDGRHDPLIRSILNDVRRMVAEDPAVSGKLAGWLDNAVAAYKRNLWGPRRWLAALVEVVVLNRDEAVEAMRDAIVRLIDELSVSRGDSLRSMLNVHLESWAGKLAAGEPEATAAFEQFRQRLLNVLDWPGLTGALLGGLAEMVDRQLQDDRPDTEAFRFIDFDALANTLARVGDELFDEVRRDPQHPLRRQVNDWLAKWAARLANADPNAVRLLNAVRVELLANMDIGRLIRAALASVSRTLLDHLSGEDTALMRLVDRVATNAMGELRRDEAARERFDAFVRERLIRLEVEHHALIGQMVKASLDRLSNESLVEQIERRVGDDLQFIRLNGAVLGFLIGLALFGGMMLFSWRW